MEPANIQVLEDMIQKLERITTTVQANAKPQTDTLILGDFNSHDQLRGRNNRVENRQGEADQIIDVIATHNLQSLLPRGTKTWQRCNQETTIDLVLASEKLAEDRVRCAIHPTEHGSDHRAIETTFSIDVPEEPQEERFRLEKSPMDKDSRKPSHAASGNPMGRRGSETDGPTDGSSESSYLNHTLKSEDPHASTRRDGGQQTCPKNGETIRGGETRPEWSAGEATCKRTWRQQLGQLLKNTIEALTSRRKDIGTISWPTRQTSGRQPST